MIEQAIFTAIPAGRLPDGRLRVTVFVTPKLAVSAPAVPGETLELAAFEAFANWPRTLEDARFVFDVDGIGAVEGSPLDEPIAPSRELWEALFGATSVGDAGFQHFEQAVVQSYPVDEVLRTVTDLYRDVAVQSGTAFPAIAGNALATFLDRVAPAYDPHRSEWAHGRRARKAYVEHWRVQSEPRSPAGGGRGRYLDIDAVPPAERPALALAAASAFYDRTDDPLDPATATAPAPTPVPPEFHTFVARCADFPELLRHLGLAVDLWIPDDPGIAEHARIRVLDGANRDPLERLLAPQGARPFTRLHRTDRFWAPAPAREEPDLRDGSLVVDDVELFLVDQADPDGAALKVAALAMGLVRTEAELDRSAQANDHAPSMTDDRSSLPALRSAGLIVARRNRAKSMVRLFDTTAAHEDDRAADRPAMLGAAEVTRGWRVDVQDRQVGDTWFSLHRRRGAYELLVPGAASAPLPLDVPPGPDEGYLKAATTSSTRADVAADQYLHETLAGWDGWSLAVKRPGRIVDETRLADPTVDPATGAGPGAEPGVADSGFPLATRFGVEPGSLPRLRFGRSYRIRVRAVDLSGTSIPGDQLDPEHERDLDGPYQRWEPVPSPAVIPLTEYTEGESLMRMVIRSTRDVPVADYVRLDRVTGLAGHVASGDLGIVYREENERNLAAPLGSVQLAETHGLLDAALAGDPAAVAAQFDIASREAGSYLTLPGGRVVSTHAVPTALDGTKEQRLQDGEYVVHATRALALPYLPDPLSRGISLTMLPGDGTPGAPTTRLIRWPGEQQTWFDRRPILVRIVEGDAAPAFDEDERTLTVSLPKATLVTVRLSSFIDSDDVDLMRIWGLMQAAWAPPTAADRSRIHQGLHWMITPATELTLVHAVEQPLERPAIELDARTLRTAGTTFSYLPGIVRNHAASTGRLDIDATWEDPFDDVLAPRWTSEPKAAHVADFPVQQDETKALMWDVSGPPVGPLGPRHEVRHEFGDTRHRYVTYTPTATTRFREYFPPEITSRRELVTSVGDGLRVDVPSSARPMEPDVRYVVPTWTWEESPLPVDGSPLAVRRVRTGGGLRVYLGRPWWSSGPDEQLGVVLARQPWITWPVDRDRGVLGALEAQTAAEGWARRALEAADVHVDEGTPAASQFATGIADAVRAFTAGAGRQGGGDDGAARRDAPAGRLGRLGILPAGFGVAAGLDVVAEGGRLVVTPGAAVDAFGRDLRPAGIEPRNAAERFLLRADEAITASRRDDPASSAMLESAVTSKLLGDFLTLFNSTGPEGRRFCSAWGADPVFEGEALPSGPYTHQFPLRTEVGSGIALAEVPDEVTVVGHTPEFDEERGLWYCDIQVAAGDAYTPFIQLALVRYQSHSVRGQEISKVVKADWAQLVPRREATFVVAPDDPVVAVTVAGTVGVPAYAVGLPDLASRVRASRRVEAWVELLPAGATSDLDWERVGDPVALEVRLGLAAIRRSDYAEVEWVGAVALPERAPGDRVRVRVAEHEIHATDRDPEAGLVLVVLPARDRRVVYSDEVEVPAAG